MAEAPETREAIIIASIHAQRVQRDLLPALVMLQDLGLRIVAVHPLRGSEGVAEIIDLVRERGVKLVVTAGGDGTVGAVVSCIATTDIQLGVLPLGTSNDFARSLGVPLDLQSACHTIVHGTARKVDLGLITMADGSHRYFAQAAIVGLNSQFARLVTTVRWRKRFGIFGYPLAAIHVLRNREVIEVHITEDGKHLHGRVLQAGVLNAPLFGGGFTMRVPDATLTDRRLDLLVVGDVHPAALLHALRVVVGRRVRRVPYTYVAHPKQVRIETTQPQDISVDGELAGKTPVTIESAPRALTVIG